MQYALIRKRKWVEQQILCLAVMGRISLRNELTSLQKNPMVDKEGILMQMVFAVLD
jgi:hypothetical protein